MDELQILLALHAPLSGRDLASQLRALGLSVEVSRNQADTWIALRDRPPHAVLLAPIQETGDSAELLSLFRSRASGTTSPAVVVLTDRPGFLDDRAEDIDDFLSPEDSADHIVRRLVYAIARQAARLRLADEKEHLLRASTTDFKTGLANDRQFSEACRIECARAVRENHWLGVLMIDIDHFKNINDQHDHNFGDYVLLKLADTLRDGLRPFDTPARKGGDEFAVLLPSANLESSRTIAERLRASFAALELSQGGHQARSSITIGVAAWHPESEESVETVLANADRALLAAKDSGRNLVRAHADLSGGRPQPAIKAAPPKSKTKRSKKAPPEGPRTH
jgi:diguanylate cyclase (GGDEF)-like protein